MPRYHLHIHCDGQVIEDDEGGEFASLDAAFREAVRSIRSLVCGDVMDGKMYLDQCIEIRDDAGRALGGVRFQDAIETIPIRKRGDSANDL